MAGKKNIKRRSGNVRKNRRSVLAISSVILVLGMVVLFCEISLKEKNDAYRVKEAELQAQIEEEQERSEEIDALKEYVGTDEYIESVAKEKLGLIHENEILFKAQE